MRRSRIATSHHPAHQVFQIQDVARQSDPITQNQWYDAWDGSAVAAGAGSVVTNVSVYVISVDQAIANEDLEIRIIADNIDETITQTAVAGTDYYVMFDVDPDNLTYFTLADAAALATAERRMPVIPQARSLQIMYRKTSAAGGNDTTIKILYAQIP